MAHHAVPALIHTRPIRPIVARERHQHSAPDSGICTDTDSTPKTVKLISRGSLWCCFFLIIPFAIPIPIMFVKDSDGTRRVFLGIFTTVMIIFLVGFSVAVFYNFTEDTVLPRHNTDMSTSHRLLLNCAPSATASTTNSSGHQHSQQSFHWALSPVHHSYQFSICNRSGPSTSDSVEITRSKADDPPEYHAALSLPLPEVHVYIPEPLETPPPAYDKVLA